MENRIAEFIFRLREIAEESWRPVRLPAFVGGVSFSVWILYFAFSGDRWVPILDGANLLFHEAGHPFFGALGERLGVYGGTLGQLVFPVVTTAYFWRLRSTGSFFVCGVWVFENLLNIARYMADARAQLLPLVGGGEHDWTEILSRWGLLSRDRVLAGGLSFLAATGIVALGIWFGRQYAQSVNSA